LTAEFQRVLQRKVDTQGENKGEKIGSNWFW
jgi:hypothetical protein